MALEVQVTKQGLPIVIPSTELYNSVMQSIEPELTSYSLQSVDFLSDESSPVQLKIRAQRYEKAFKQFYKLLEEYNDDWQRHLHLYKKKSRTSLEVQDQESELQTLQDFFS